MPRRKRGIQQLLTPKILATLEIAGSSAFADDDAERA
jgi:hypothetical protein